MNGCPFTAPYYLSRMCYKWLLSFRQHQLKGDSLNMVIAVSAKKTIIVTTVAAYTLSLGAAFANPQSALDPYASVQAPTAESQAAAKAKKAQKKFGLPLVSLGKKKPVETKKTAPQNNDLNTTQTIVSTPGAKSKTIKHSEVAELAPEPSTKVSETTKEKIGEAGGGGGMMDGLKTISTGCGKTFKAATSGVVSGTMKVGSGIAGGAKASGSFLAKGMKSTGDALKSGTGVVGEKLMSTGSAVKDGTQTTFGKLAGIGKKSPMQKTAGMNTQTADLSTSGSAAPLITKKENQLTPSPIANTPIGAQSGPSGLSKFKIWGFKNKQTASKKVNNPL
jgi:hypothetical protein